jgi:transcriptional regulator with XRE-family HTH domain
MACTPRPGDQLRELRNHLGITTREVEELSRTLAERTGNEEYYISNAWLTQLENKDSVPSIYKLFSLSVIYRSTFSNLLAIFGIDLASSARYQLEVPLANTHRVAFERPHPAAAVTFQYASIEASASRRQTWFPAR